MAYVTHGCKELKSSYKKDTLEVGKEMALIPVDGSTVLKKEKKGIG